MLEVKFHFGDKNVERCSAYKYLGVHIDENLSFSKLDEAMSKQAKKVLGALIYKYKTMGNMGSKTFTKLFETNVVPILDYGMEILGHRGFPKLDAM